MDDWPEGAQHAVLCDHRGTLAASACALVGAEGHLEHALVDAAGRGGDALLAEHAGARLSVAARVDAGWGRRSVTPSLPTQPCERQVCGQRRAAHRAALPEPESSRTGKDRRDAHHTYGGDSSRQRGGAPASNPCDTFLGPDLRRLMVGLVPCGVRRVSGQDEISFSR